MNARSQTGVAFAASVAAYQANRIRRHELTRPRKENDRVRHVAARAKVEALGAALGALDALYIADGHHRSAAASRCSGTRPARRSRATSSFSRCRVSARRDADPRLQPRGRRLSGLSPDALLAKVGASFGVELVPQFQRPKPRGRAMPPRIARGNASRARGSRSSTCSPPRSAGSAQRDRRSAWIQRPLSTRTVPHAGPASGSLAPSRFFVGVQSAALVSPVRGRAPDGRLLHDGGGRRPCILAPFILLIIAAASARRWT